MKYNVSSKVTIRKGIGIHEGVKDKVPYSNAMGMLDVGKQVEILGTQVLADNTLWGRISEPDATGTSQWVCIKGLNTTFLTVAPSEEEPQDRDSRLARIEMKLDMILSKLK